MARLAIHLNDAELTAFNGERIICREPGFAWLGSDGLVTGREAFAHSRIDPRRVLHRYWSELSTNPLPDHHFRHYSAADLAARQLEEIWSRHGDGVDALVVAVPAYMTAENLGLLLGIAAEQHLPVVAMVDAAVAATRREYQRAVLVHVDLTLHKAILTRLAQPGMTQVDRTEVLDGAGLFALYDSWLKALSDAFVRESRFDPLHTAKTEQMLLDRLDGWLREAAIQDRVVMQVEAGSHVYTAEMESLALIGAAAPVYQKIASMLRSFFHAEDVPAVQVTDRVARMPGLTDMLKARVGGEVFVLEPGATARGALARCRGSGDAAKGVSLLRQLPWDQSPIDLQEQVLEKRSTGAPTHLLFGYTAYEIGNSPLVLGSEGNGDSNLIGLGSDMPGVSRRHCSLVAREGECVLEDHSRYGTFLNGHRVEGSAVLQVGDALRIGSPGYEFQLITTDTEHG